MNDIGGFRILNAYFLIRSFTFSDFKYRKTQKSRSYHEKCLDCIRGIQHQMVPEVVPRLENCLHTVTEHVVDWRVSDRDPDDRNEPEEVETFQVNSHYLFPRSAYQFEVGN